MESLEKKWVQLSKNNLTFNFPELTPGTCLPQDAEILGVMLRECGL